MIGENTNTAILELRRNAERDVIIDVTDADGAAIPVAEWAGATAVYRLTAYDATVAAISWTQADAEMTLDGANSRVLLNFAPADTTALAVNEYRHEMRLTFVVPSAFVGTWDIFHDAVKVYPSLA